MTGGTLPAYLCLAPQPGVSARYLGFSPSTPGAQGAGFAEPQNGTYLQLVAVRGAWNSQTMQDWAGLVVDDTVSPALTVEGMFAALWTQCVGTPWDAPLGASLLGWMFCYPFCNPDSSPNHSVWLSTITSEVFGTMYKPYIKEGKPGWGDGDPPMPPPPNVR
jgi:hypothetical protein